MEQLNSENQELQTRLEMDVKSSAQYKELEDQLQQIRQSYEEAIQINQNILDESAEKLEAAARELESEKKKLNDAHEDAESKRELAEKERNDMHQKLEDQNEKLRELTSANEEHIQSAQQLMKDMDTLRLTYEKEQAAMEEKRLEQLDTLNSKDMELKSIGIELKDAVEAVSKMTEELMENKAQQESLKSKIKELEGQETSSFERIELLEKEKTDLLSSLDDLKEKVLLSGNEKEEITKLEEELASLRSSLEAANDAHESEKMQTLVQTNVELEAQINALKDQVTAMNMDTDKLVALQKEYDNLKQERDAALNETKESSVERSCDSKKHNMDYESQLDSLQTIIDKLKCELETLSETNNKQAATIKSNNDKLELVDKEKTDMREQLKKLNGALEDAVDHSNSLKAEIDRLTEAKQAAVTSSSEEILRELEETKSKLEELQDTNVALEEAVQDIQLEKEDLEAENEGNTYRNILLNIAAAYTYISRNLLLTRACNKTW